MRSIIGLCLIVSLLTAEFVKRFPRAVQPDQDSVITHRLIVISTPSEADVFIDGQPIGTTPYAGRFEPGAYQLRVSKDGYTLWEHRLALQEDERFVITLSRFAPPRNRGWLWTLLGVAVGSAIAAAAYVIIKARVSGSPSDGAATELPALPPSPP